MTCVGTEQLRTGNIRREDMGEKIKNMFRGHKEKKKNQNGGFSYMLASFTSINAAGSSRSS